MNKEESQMKWHMSRLVFLMVVALMIHQSLITSANGDAPGILSYQGRVAVNGTNFDGTGQFKFALVNSNGVVSFWSNDGTSSGGGEPVSAVTVLVSKGLYSVLLGDGSLSNMIPIAATIFTNSDVRLRLWFNDGSAGWRRLDPDERLASASYALVADTALNTQRINVEVPVLSDEFDDDLDRTNTIDGGAAPWTKKTSGFSGSQTVQGRGMFHLQSGSFGNGGGSASISSLRTVNLSEGTVVFKARCMPYEDNQSVYGDGQPRGLVNGTNRANAIEFISQSGVAIQARTVKNGVATVTNYNLPGTYPDNSVNKLREYTIIASSNKVQFYVEGILIAVHTTNIPTVNLGAYFGTSYPYAGSIHMFVDKAQVSYLRQF